VRSSIFDARSCAVIGASAEKGKVGYAVVENLKDSFKGRIYPVNPKYRRLQGLPCFPSVLDIKAPVDLAVVSIPAKFVPQVLLECGRKKIPNAVVISAGFKETGAEGAKLEKECIEIARKHGMRILGPNCLGIISTASGLNATFASQTPIQGNIAFMSQSGALCTAILDWAEVEGVGFSNFVSLGNKADLSENDFLALFGSDKKTNVILSYLESLVDGGRFMALSRRVTKRKPVIVLKAGRTQAGAKAAASHTGALAGSDSAFDAALAQCGVIRVESGEQLFDFAQAFSVQPTPRGDRVAIVTNAGGPGIMTTDACDRRGLRLASFSEKTLNQLRKNLPPSANIYNPVDVLGDADAARYALAVEAVLSDRNVDSAVCVLTPQAMTDSKAIAEEVARVSRAKRKTVVACFMGGTDMKAGVAQLKAAGIPNYPYPERAAEVVASMVRYARIRKFRHKKPPQLSGIDRKKAEAIVKAFYRTGRVAFGLDCFALLEAYGVRTLKSRFVTSPGEAKKAAEELGFPVAVKVASQDILHKSDVGGVALNVGREEFEHAYNKVLFSARKFMPKARIEGVFVQEMISRGREVIVGINREPQIGSIVMFGLGGIYVEVMKDVSFRVAPLNEDEARNMIPEVKGYRILSGARGEAPSDVASLIDLLLRVSRLSADFPEILELDLNPVKVFEAGAGFTVVDARMVLDEKLNKSKNKEVT
jgi:acetyltransferase